MPADHMRILHKRENHTFNPRAVVDIQRVFHSLDEINEENARRELSHAIKTEEWEYFGKRGRKPGLKLIDVNEARRIFKSQVENKKKPGFSVPQMNYLHREYDMYLNSLADLKDVYISQNAFNAWRREDNWLCLGALYLDFDHPETVGINTHDLSANIIAFCDRIGLPRPSYLMSTGIGLAAVWLHSYIHRPKNSKGGYGRWKAAEDKLHKIFKEFQYGALLDNKVKDAARILRLAGSINSKVNDVVHPLFVNGSDEYHPESYDFNFLADCIHGTVLEEKFRSERAAKWAEADRVYKETKAKKIAEAALRKQQMTVHTNYNRLPAEAPRKATEGTYSTDGNVITLTASKQRKNLSRTPISEMIISDLYKVFQGRGGIKEGMRDTWMFIMTVNKALISPVSEVIDDVRKLASMVGFDEKTAMSYMSTTIRRAKDSGDGKTIQYNGYEVDPRYRFKVKTIIELLQITEKEMKDYGLGILLSEELKKEKRRLSKAISRNQTTTPRSIEAIKEAARIRLNLLTGLLKNNLSTRKLASLLDISQSMVRKMMKLSDISLAA